MHLAWPAAPCLDPHGFVPRRWIGVLRCCLESLLEQLGDGDKQELALLSHDPVPQTAYTSTSRCARIKECKKGKTMEAIKAQGQQPAGDFEVKGEDGILGHSKTMEATDKAVASDWYTRTSSSLASCKEFL